MILIAEVNGITFELENNSEVDEIEEVKHPSELNNFVYFVASNKNVQI